MKNFETPNNNNTTSIVYLPKQMENNKLNGPDKIAKAHQVIRSTCTGLLGLIKEYEEQEIKEKKQ